MRFFQTSKKQLVILVVAFLVLVPAVNVFTSFALPAAQDLENPDDALVRIGHFAPFEEGDASIRVVMNGTARVDDFIYGWSTGRLPLAAEEYVVEVYKVGETQTPLKTGTVTLEPGKKYTLIFIGNNIDQPFDIALIDDDLIAAEPSSAAIAFGHFAPLSGNLTGTTIDIREDTGILARNDLVYGLFDPADTDQLTKTTTSYIVTSSSGANTFVDLQTFGYNQGDLQYLLLVGDGRHKPIRAYMFVNDGPGGFMSQTGDPMFIPPSIAFANFYNSEEVEAVEFNFGPAVSETVAWGALSDAQTHEVGEYTLTAKDVQTGDTILTQQIQLGLSETVIFALTQNNTDGAPLLVPVFGDYLETDIIPPKIRFVHLAPFASGAFATLDVRRDNGLIFEDDLSFGEAGGFRTVAPGEYTFRYTTRDGERTLFDPDPFSIKNGDNITVFLIGDGESQLIRLLVHVDNKGMLSQKAWESPLGRLSVINLAPTGEGDGSNTRLEIDSETAATQFGFGDFLPAEPIIAGQHVIKVVDEATNGLLASRVVSISPSTYHLLVLSGDNVNEPYKIEFFEQNTAAPVNSLAASLHFGNYAILPQAGSGMDEISLITPAQTLFSGLAYGEFLVNSPRTILSNTYDLTYEDAESNEVPENHYEVTINPGANVFLFAVGDGDRQPYGLFMMDADGRNGRLLRDIENEIFELFLPAIYSE